MSATCHLDWLTFTPTKFILSNQSRFYHQQFSCSDYIVLFCRDFFVITQLNCQRYLRCIIAFVDSKLFCFSIFSKLLTLQSWWLDLLHKWLKYCLHDLYQWKHDSTETWSIYIIFFPVQFISIKNQYAENRLLRRACNPIPWTAISILNKA